MNKRFQWCFEYNKREKCWEYEDFNRLETEDTISQQKSYIRELLYNGFDTVLLEMTQHKFKKSWDLAIVHFELTEEPNEDGIRLNMKSVSNIKIESFNYSK